MVCKEDGRNQELPSQICTILKVSLSFSLLETPTDSEIQISEH